MEPGQFLFECHNRCEQIAKAFDPFQNVGSFKSQ